jgi:hypothetical protein
MVPTVRRTLLAAPMLFAVALITVLALSAVEEQDSFCTGCHLAPETTYVRRATTGGEAANASDVFDLASFHYWSARQDGDSFRCIDCHRGDNTVRQRAAVLLLAAADTLTFLRGNADQTVAKGDVPNPHATLDTWLGPEAFNRRPDILNASCRACHQKTLTLVGFENHFHNRLPAARNAYQETGELVYPDDWGSATGTGRLLQNDNTVLTCLDCHRAHVAGFESEFFLSPEQIVFPACEKCHLETGRGPLGLVN